jgi:hypothetical protein
VPTRPLSVKEILTAVSAYHAALDAGWPPPSANVPRGSPTAIAGTTRALKIVSANSAAKIYHRLDSAVHLGAKVREWSLGERWPGSTGNDLILRYRLYFPEFSAEIAAFNERQAGSRIKEQAIESGPMTDQRLEEFKTAWAAVPSERGGIIVEPPLVSEATPETPLMPAPEPRDVLEARRDKNAIASLKASLKAMEARAVDAEDRASLMDALHKARVEPTQWLAAPHVQSVLSLTPLLFTSDFQAGEVVRPDEIDGINEYNQDIFAERYQTMIDKTIMLATENTGATEFPGVVYLRGGDAISGEIHDELAETNDLSAVPAARLVYQQEREGIKRLRDRFGRVRVISLPGNHGRTTFKSHAKNYALRNFETLLSWWLADSFSDDPYISFWTPMSADALFEVEGWSGLLSHGDRMGSRGGQGFVGPAATIARGHQKLFQNWTATGQRVDFVLTGHLHTSLKLERGFANGALVGYNEYARDLRCLPDAAKQWLLFVHHKEMISHQFELQLSRKPRRHVADQSDLGA